MSELQTVSVTIGILPACISVVIGVVNQIVSNRRAEEQRQMQLFTQVYDRVIEKAFTEQYTAITELWQWKDDEDFDQKYMLPANVDAYNTLLSYMRFLSYVSVIVNRGLIAFDLVDDLLAIPIIQYWEKYEAQIKRYRIRTKQPELWDDIETLYNRVRKQR